MSPSALLLSSSVASHFSGFCTKLSILLVSVFICNLSFAQNSVTGQLVLDTAKTGFTGPIIVEFSPEIKKMFNRDGPVPVLTAEQKKKRQWSIAAVNVVGYGGSLIILNDAWYKGYARTSFHTFNDNGEWLQVDKLGHAWAANNAGKVSAAMWEWSGIPHGKAVLIGGLSSTLYLTAIEFLDGHSSKWGWSWGDMSANVIGSGLFIGQETLWKEERIQYKFSFHKNNYIEPVLETRADDLFGKTWYERMLKDYNAQAYWFSVNLKSFLPKSDWPAWLNIAVGYGAGGMYGGFENKWLDKQGNAIDRSDIPRKRQFYLAPDIDFTKIKTNKKWLRTAFTFLNAFKCPAPALMIDSKGKMKAYALYF